MLPLSSPSPQNRESESVRRSAGQRRSWPEPVRPETQPILSAAKLRVGIPRHNLMSRDSLFPPDPLYLFAVPAEGLPPRGEFGTLHSPPGVARAGRPDDALSV